MADARNCPQCGAELPPDAPAGLCPNCLMQLGFESQISGTQQKGEGSVPDPRDHEPTPTTPMTGSFIPPQPEDLAAHFPHLEILELLGKGGMGAVYKARQPHLDRLVALKILPPEVGADAAFQERFTREARALAKLNHPHIVAVYDFGQTSARSARVSDPAETEDRRSPASGETSGQAGGSVGNRPQRDDGSLYYFLMEYVDGANIRELIHRGGLKPDEALAIVPQICEALQFAHDEGIVHRDIKPENILVDTKGRVKIADFGLAKLIQPAPEPAAQARDATAEKGVRGVTLTGTGQIMGTVHYMAPEQMKGSHAVDHRADIYSLGVVFYEMLTGELPIGKFEPPSQKVHIDVRLDDVVLRSLENEPSRRYQHASDVKTAIETISGSQRPAVISPPTAQPVSLADRELIESARRQVRGPAIGLILSGCVGPVMAVIGTAAAVGTQRLGHLELTILLGIAFWESVLGLIIIVGAQKMRRLESYGFAMVGAILAVLPITGPHYILSLPMGIWALIVLTGPQVKAAFVRMHDEPLRSAVGSRTETQAWVATYYRRLTGRWSGRFGILASAIFVGYLVNRLFLPHVSGALWGVVLVVSLLGFLVDVLRHPGQLKGLQAAFPLLAGLTTMLIYFIADPQPLLNGLYRISDGTPSKDDSTFLRVVVGFIVAWLIWQMVQVHRKIKSRQIGPATVGGLSAPEPPQVPLGQPPVPPPALLRDDAPHPVGQPHPTVTPPAATANQEMPESVRRQLRGPAIGLIAGSIVECVILIAGIVFIISIIGAALVWEYPPPRQSPAPPPPIKTHSAWHTLTGKKDVASRGVQPPGSQGTDRTKVRLVQGVPAASDRDSDLTCVVFRRC